MIWIKRLSFWAVIWFRWVAVYREISALNRSMPRFLWIGSRNQLKLKICSRRESLAFQWHSAEMGADKDILLTNKGSRFFHFFFAALSVSVLFMTLVQSIFEPCHSEQIHKSTVTTSFTLKKKKRLRNHPTMLFVKDTKKSLLDSTGYRYLIQMFNSPSEYCLELHIQNRYRF